VTTDDLFIHSFYSATKGQKIQYYTVRTYVHNCIYTSHIYAYTHVIATQVLRTALKV